MPLDNAYVPNYYSIDDILATQERAPCRFLQTVPKLGKLNPSADEPDLNVGTVLELPLWLVSEIGSGRQAFVAPELPKVYKETYREILKADPCAVDLPKFGLYFYEVGAHVRKFDDRGEVGEILMNTFKLRFRQLLDLADNNLYNPSAQQKLDILERTLFKSGHEARIRLNTWLMDSTSPLEAANMVINHKKRKRVDIENF